jgi:alpha-tubulin suppressor-like RCC1 family protein
MVSKVGSGAVWLPLVVALAACGGPPPKPIVDAADAVAFPVLEVVQLASGDDHTCALRSDGRVVCWMCSQCGWTGKPDPELPPVEPRLVEGVSDAVSIWAHGVGTCARLSGGETTCFGHEAFAGFDSAPAERKRVAWHVCERKGGTRECRRFDREAPSEDLEFVCEQNRDFRHEYEECDTRVDKEPISTTVFDSVLCETSDEVRWREPLDDQLLAPWGGCRRRAGLVSCERFSGDETETIQLPVAADAAELALLDTEPILCARFDDGVVDCFTIDGERSRLATDARRLFGGERICVWHQNGTLSCTTFGLGTHLRHDSWKPFDAEELVDVAEFVNLFRAEARDEIGCAEPADGPPACWRWHQSFYDGGELYYYTDEKRTPVHSVPSIAGVAELSLGANHGCAITTYGEVRCFGRRPPRVQPDPIVHRTGWATPTGIEGVTANEGLVSGAGHVCALGGQRAYCFGANRDGQLGDGTSESRLAPAPVVDLDDASALAAGAAHTCALRSGGRVSCWGANRDGQLGDGTNESRARPVQVPKLRGIVELSAAEARTCARDRAGRVTCWGRGWGSAPRKQSRLGRVKAIGVSRENVCGVARGAVVCLDERGKLHKVGRSKGAVSIERDCFVKQDGEAGCFGRHYVWERTPEDAHVVLFGFGLNADEPVRTLAVENSFSHSPEIRLVTESGKLIGARDPVPPLCPPDGCDQYAICPPEPEPIPEVWPGGAPDENAVIDAWAGSDHICAALMGGRLICWGWTETRVETPPLAPVEDHWPTTKVDVLDPR